MRKHRDLCPHHFIIQKKKISQFGSHDTKLLPVLSQMQDAQPQSSLGPKALPGSVLAADPTSGRDLVYLLIFP